MAFIISKLGWMLVQPSNLALLLLAIAILFDWRWLSALVVAGLLLVSLLPVGLWLTQPLETRFPRPEDLPDTVDGIIVLGGPQEAWITRARGVIATNEAAERLIEAAALAERYPDATLVFSGGDGTLGGGSGGEQVVNQRFVELMRLDAARVVHEARSRNTWENALFTKELVNPAPGQAWLLVTSAAHMPRSIGIFRQIGWEVLPFPVDYWTTGGTEWPGRIEVSMRLLELDYAMREWVGLAAYHLMDRTETFLPGP